MRAGRVGPEPAAPVKSRVAPDEELLTVKSPPTARRWTPATADQSRVPAPVTDPVTVESASGRTRDPDETVKDEATARPAPAVWVPPDTTN